MGQISGNSQTPIAPNIPTRPEPPVAPILGLKTVCASGLVTRGIDVSSYQPTIDFAAVKSEGYAFAFIKASEGAGHADPHFVRHWANAKAAGVIRGAYHFFHPGVDPIAQAAFFAKCVGPLGADDMPCVLDWETTDNVPTSTDYANGLACLKEIERLTGKRPIVYTGPYFVQALRPTAEIVNYPLWLAHYGPKCPLVPWPWATWLFWQTSGSMSVKGVVGACDVDQFNGTIADLKAFIARS